MRNIDTQVKDSRPAEDDVSILAAAGFAACGGRFTTYERVQLRDLVVIKSRQARGFRPDQARAVHPHRHAAPDRARAHRPDDFRHRPAAGEPGDTDISSKQIGEIVMESPARIDTVAYVRFASVYKNFQAADDFDRRQRAAPARPAEE